MKAILCAMVRVKRFFAAVIVLMVVVAAVALHQRAATAEEANRAAAVRQAVEKSLPFLAKEAVEWETKRCVSCHHGPWMMWSGYEAKKRGFTVDEKALEQIRTNALKQYGKHPTLRPSNRDALLDLSINSIYHTFAMSAAGEPDAETAQYFDKAAAHLIEQQKEDGSWKVFIKKTTKKGETITFLMAPLIDSDDVTTMWALLALYSREPAGVSKDVLEKSKERGLKFLCDNPSSDTLQSLVLRIMLNQRLGKTETVQGLVKDLLASQKNDGGWSQTKKLKSDALGTGQALVALSTAGITAREPAIANAWEYLCKTQKEDGSWFVASRAYEPPPFSSYLGTAWATLGMVRTLPAGRTP